MVAGLCGCSSQTDALLSGTPSLSTARVALSGGSADVALSICDRLLDKRPKESGLLACRGDALAAMGRNAEATGAYELALVADGKSVPAKIGLGRIRLASDPAAAEALFLDALVRDPRNPTALNNLGIARDLQGRHADAQTAYAEAIGAAPEMRAAQVNLALSLAMSGRAGEGVRILRPIAGRADATARERHDLAAVLAMDGKPEEAVKLLRPELDGAQTDEAVVGFRSLRVR